MYALAHLRTSRSIGRVRANLCMRLLAEFKRLIYGTRVREAGESPCYSVSRSRDDDSEIDTGRSRGVRTTRTIKHTARK